MNEHPGLRRITKFPDTNQDTVVAIVMRFLQEHVLTKVRNDHEPKFIQTDALIEFD